MNSWIYLLLLSCITLNRNVLAFSNDTTNCTILLDTFADETSQFISCAIYNSRPITLCESCVDSYIDVLDSYNNMTKFSDNGTLCIDNFVNLDRLQIIKTLFSNSFNLWDTAKCSECFHIVNGSLSPNRSKEALKFNDKYTRLMNCINRTDLNDTTLCPVCMDAYVDLNSYYLSISNVNENIGVCMDIVDLMNTTWSFWSKKCCKYRHHNEYYFIASTIAVFLVTALFYLVVQLWSEKRTPAILQQTRFAGSLTNIN